MKKAYIAPCIEVVKVNATTMICESLGFSATEVTSMDSKIRGSRTSDDDFDDLW